MSHDDDNGEFLSAEALKELLGSTHTGLVAKSFSPSTLLGELEIEMPPTLDSAATQREPVAGRRTLHPAASLDVMHVGRYEVGDEIGSGGMGCVYEAYDPELRRTVALKVLHASTRIDARKLQRFVAEAQITSQLEHPSIVPVYDFGVDDTGQFFYVMKRVQGMALHDLINTLREASTEPPDWSLHKRIDVFLNICQAMGYAHARGVLHRDLKPSNIMLGEFGEVLVLDWGIAGIIGQMTAEEAMQAARGVNRLTMHRTQDGVVIGTPTQHPRGPRSDLRARPRAQSLRPLPQRARARRGHRGLPRGQYPKGSRARDVVVSAMLKPS